MCVLRGIITGSLPFKNAEKVYIRKTFFNTKFIGAAVRRSKISQDFIVSTDVGLTESCGKPFLLVELMGRLSFQTTVFNQKSAKIKMESDQQRSRGLLEGEVIYDKMHSTKLDHTHSTMVSIIIFYWRYLYIKSNDTHIQNLQIKNNKN